MLVLLIAVCAVIWVGAYSRPGQQSIYGQQTGPRRWPKQAAPIGSLHGRRSHGGYVVRRNSRRTTGQALLSFRSGLDLDRDDVVLWRALSAVATGAELRLAQERVAQLDPRGPEGTGATG